LIKTELREWSVSPTSPMPSYTNAFTAAEIADIISYLLSLKGSHP
jgi:mono/diheme cytochrome c family protein